MWRTWLSKIKLPTPQEIAGYPCIRLFGCHLQHHALWQFNRRSVAGGLAVGLFFGIVIPFGQSLLAAMVAVLLRVNLPVAAGATFVTNPFTTLPIYFLAYKIGEVLTGWITQAPSASAEALQRLLERPERWQDWLGNLLAWVQTAGVPLLTGVVVLSALSALAGYTACSFIWRINTLRRWKRRAARRK